MRRWLLALRCWWGGCPGYVISGWRGPVLFIGWRCSDCGKIKHYEPSRVRRDTPDTKEDGHDAS